MIPQSGIMEVYMSSIFPFLNSGVDKPQIPSELKLFEEIAWDYENNTPLIIDGEFKKVYKNDALKVWIYKALKTERYKYPIYSWNYGNELERLVGINNYPEMIKSKMIRYINEAVLINPYLNSISNITISSDSDKINVSFEVKTIYGNMEVNAIV